MGHLLGVFAVPFHSEAEGFEPLKDQESAVRRQRCAGVAQWYDTRATDIGSRAERLGIDDDFMASHDVHVHFPAGAVPKDGPSAGIAVATAIVSALTRRPARVDVAMTGEITLRGHVLPIGGVREKVLAAHRAGIREVILPERNRKDEPEMPDQVRAEMTFHYVRTIGEVLDIVLLAGDERVAAE